MVNSTGFKLLQEFFIAGAGGAPVIDGLEGKERFYAWAVEKEAIKKVLEKPKRMINDIDLA